MNEKEVSGCRLDAYEVAGVIDVEVAEVVNDCFEQPEAGSLMGEEGTIKGRQIERGANTP